MTKINLGGLMCVSVVEATGQSYAGGMCQDVCCNENCNVRTIGVQRIVRLQINSFIIKENVSKDTYRGGRYSCFQKY